MKGFRFSHRVTVLRRALVDDGFQKVPGPAEEVCTVWAARQDVSDGERLRAGEKAAELVARFVVRRSAVTEGISASNTLRLGPLGPELEIVGAKFIREGALVEITTAARSDR